MEGGERAQVVLTMSHILMDGGIKISCTFDSGEGFSSPLIPAQQDGVDGPVGHTLLLGASQLEPLASHRVSNVRHTELAVPNAEHVGYGFVGGYTPGEAPSQQGERTEEDLVDPVVDKLTHLGQVVSGHPRQVRLQLGPQVTQLTEVWEAKLGRILGYDSDRTESTLTLVG